MQTEIQLNDTKKELTKNIARSFAEFVHWNNELEEITSEEFWTVYESNKDLEHTTKLHQIDYSDFPCSCWSFCIDGYDYFSYGYLINVGWEGDKDSIPFICRKKCLTHKEMNDVLHSLYPLAE